MWSKIDPNSDNDLNYLVDDCFREGKCRPDNAIQIMEIFFMPYVVASRDKIATYSYGVCIFKDAKRVLTEEEIIDEVNRSRAPDAKFVKKIVY